MMRNQEQGFRAGDPTGRDTCKDGGGGCAQGKSGKLGPLGYTEVLKFHQLLK